MTATPDTTEAVTTALQALVDATSVGEFNDRQLRDLFVSTAIAADRKALAEQGYVIVERDVLTAYIDGHVETVDGEWGLSRGVFELKKDGELDNDYALFGLVP